ncbi:MAG: ATP-binding protein [Clostridiaceae bacterium]|nr:ATP-binding protein [Clostridiaceae bacterium]
MFNEKRVRIIIGHYGSGKTEFAVNYTFGLAAQGKKTSIVDLDIVNPYFRSREIEPQFVEKGIRVISSSIKGLSGDLPALSPEIYSVLQDTSYEVVFDVGGDMVGARALGRYHEYFDREPYDMLFVLNANRHQTNTVDGAVSYLRSIEDSSKQKVTALVNNTHLCGNTTVEEIMKGQKLCEDVSTVLGLPIKYVVVEKKFVDMLPKGLQGEVLPIDIYMTKPWED